MRAAMAAAEVGDDVYGEDPTVNRLQEIAAEMFGKEAALFVPSGTQSNLLALLTHCGRGDEYIVGQQAHTYNTRAAAPRCWAASSRSRCQPAGRLHRAGGRRGHIKPDDCHFARTRLLSLENTIGGRVLAATTWRRLPALAHGRGLAMHLDGARIFNAAVNGRRLPAATAGFDTVSVCLSKGLGAPVGSVLCGPRALAQVERWRKMLGGGMRQAGVIAAAGLYALEHNVERLAEDHANAAALARGLSAIARQLCSPCRKRTSLASTSRLTPCWPLRAALEAAQIRATVGPRMRLVTHLDVDAADVARTLDVFSALQGFAQMTDDVDPPEQASGRRPDARAPRPSATSPAAGSASTARWSEDPGAACSRARRR